MKFGIHYAYWENDWDTDLKQYCYKAADLGFDALEISGNAMLVMSDDELKALAGAAEKAGVTIYPCHGMAKSRDVASEDPTIRERGFAELRGLFKKMDFAGFKQLGGILYSYWPAYEFSTTTTNLQKAREISLQSMDVIAKDAKKHGITLTLEVVNRFENFMFNTAKEGVEFVQKLGHENVKLLLDAFHMNIEEDFLGDAIRTAGNHLGHFHIGECNRKVPGKGHMPWDDIARGLQDISYDGIVAMEPFVLEGGEVGDAIRLWHNLVEGDVDLDQDIRGALDFIKGKFLKQPV
jgi:D-psicose/D-tagatose/L-ribulose 3-epimerase